MKLTELRKRLEDAGLSIVSLLVDGVHFVRVSRGGVLMVEMSDRDLALAVTMALLRAERMLQVEARAPRVVVVPNEPILLTTDVSRDRNEA